MNAEVAELQSTFLKVLNRLDGLPRKTVSVIGMALPLGVGQEAPTRLMVFPLGDPPSNDDRKWRFTKADLHRAAEHFKARTEPMPILYDHGNDPAKGAKAAGWVDSVELASDGLYANVHWTDAARQEIRSGEWGFRSPGWEGEEDPLGFIYAGPLNELSLVNKPAIGGMPPIVASSQPSTQPTPPVKEKNMANVEAAKKAATAPDVAAVVEVLRKGFPNLFGAGAPDEMISEYFGPILSGGGSEPADPMMPGAEAKPPAPAVPPAFASAEDEAKKLEAATAAATATAELKKQNETLEARVKTLEAAQLSGKIINANAADRKPAEVLSFAARIRTERNAALGAAK